MVNHAEPFAYSVPVAQPLVFPFGRVARMTSDAKLAREIDKEVRCIILAIFQFGSDDRLHKHKPRGHKRPQRGAGINDQGEHAAKKIKKYKDMNRGNQPTEPQRSTEGSANHPQLPSQKTPRRIDQSENLVHTNQTPAVSSDFCYGEPVALLVADNPTLISPA